MPLGRAFRAPSRLGVRASAPRRGIGGTPPSIPVTGRTWDQVATNDGYRVIWSSTSHASAEGSIAEIQALYAPNQADCEIDINSYDIPGTGTIYWRVAVLVSGYPQQWSDESSFSA